MCLVLFCLFLLLFPAFLPAAGGDARCATAAAAAAALKWKANGVQHLFPEWIQFVSARLLMTDPRCQTQMNLLLLLWNIYLEIIRNRSLLLAGGSSIAWICLSLALIPIVEWKVNFTQLLFPEWNQFVPARLLFD